MAPKRKRIKDMTPEEVKRLTSDEVMEAVFGKRVAKKLRKATGKYEKGKNESD